MSSSNSCFLTLVQVLRRQVRWSGTIISLRISHHLLWSTVKGFSIVNEVEVDVFLEFACFFYDPVDYRIGNLISGSSAFSKSSLNIWKFSVHILLKFSLENFGTSDNKEPACNAGDPGSVPGSGRSPGEGNGYPLPFLPRESRRQRSLVGYSPWSHKESDKTKATFTNTLVPSNCYWETYLVFHSVSFDGGHKCKQHKPHPG